MRLIEGGLGGPHSPLEKPAGDNSTISPHDISLMQEAADSVPGARVLIVLPDAKPPKVYEDDCRTLTVHGGGLEETVRVYISAAREEDISSVLHRYGDLLANDESEPQI